MNIGFTGSIFTDRRKQMLQQPQVRGDMTGETRSALPCADSCK